MVAVFVAFFFGFDSSILQGFYVGLVQNMRFRCGNLVKTRWELRENAIVRKIHVFAPPK
jgi:hypothetical protein